MFDYIVTIFGHLNYPFNSSRPKVIEGYRATTRCSRITPTRCTTSHANSWTFLAQLRQRDPDSLIVMFGDHLPFLGPNFGGYTEHGLLESKRDSFTGQMFRTSTRTPLIVIDGKNGPVATGELPLFRIPELILDLLGDSSNSIVRLSKLPEADTIRPLPGLHLRITDENTSVCRNK